MKKIKRFFQKFMGNLMIRMANADIKDPDVRGMVISWIKNKFNID